MTFNVINAIGYTWEAVGVVWLAALPFARRTVRSQAAGGRVLHIMLAFLGFTLLGSHYLRQGWLGVRFVPKTLPVGFAGLGITVLGCGFAIWARMVLGVNWSGRATVKEHHELVLRGPYAMARHPIYTGLLLACVGTAIGVGEWRCIVGIVLIAMAFAVKIRKEEALMNETFPSEYPKYRQRVKAMIPGVL